MKRGGQHGRRVFIITDYRTKPPNAAIPSGANRQPGEKRLPDWIQVQELGYGYNRLALNGLNPQCEVA